jgi:surface polysaccharide O-acyltransferase-like enzyme
VDLIRTLAIFLVILLHAAIEPFPITASITQEVIVRWFSVTVYDTLTRVCVPLFVMLTGALLLQPFKVDEPLRVFLKKRAARIGLPVVFWGAAYFAWSYFADNKALTLTSIARGIATGPYYQFWYVYMLIGLYLATPLLRVFVAYAERRVLRYFLLLWFVGTIGVSILNFFGTLSLINDIFLFPGYIGYFLLGYYLLDVQARSKILYAIVFFGYAFTAIGSYFLAYYIGGTRQYFFFDFLGFNVILGSAAMFTLLCNVPIDYVEKKSKTANKLIHFIGQSSLAIFLMHVIVLESLQRGYLGVQISINTINPIIEIPLAAVVTLLICLAILYPISKVRALKKIIGVL